MAWARCKNNSFFRTDIVRLEYPARENFRQGADTASADFLSAQLLNARNVRLDYKVE